MFPCSGPHTKDKGRPGKQEPPELTSVWGCLLVKLMSVHGATRKAHTVQRQHRGAGSSETRRMKDDLRQSSCATPRAAEKDEQAVHEHDTRCNSSDPVFASSYPVQLDNLPHHCGTQLRLGGKCCSGLGVIISLPRRLLQQARPPSHDDVGRPEPPS